MTRGREPRYSSESQCIHPCTYVHMQVAGNYRYSYLLLGGSVLRLFGVHCLLGNECSTKSLPSTPNLDVENYAQYN
jgi:hypothetical protein